MDKIIIIGYSGHSYVACNIFQSVASKVYAYCDHIEKSVNPFSLVYLGRESDIKALEMLSMNPFFIAIGDNKTRKNIKL
jgi:hypothetical protein